jgi:hypothetical protein
MTMTLVSTVTVGAGGAASIEFTGIPATGTDLLLVYSCRSSYASANVELGITFNNTGGTAYSSRMLYGQNGSVSSFASTGASRFVWPVMNGSTSTANTFASGSVYIPNYAGSTNKSVSMEYATENNSSTATMGIDAGLWANTAAITSIKLTDGYGGSIVQYSTASLYTITKGSGGATVS